MMVRFANLPKDYSSDSPNIIVNDDSDGESVVSSFDSVTAGKAKFGRCQEQVEGLISLVMDRLEVRGLFIMCVGVIPVKAELLACSINLPKYPRLISASHDPLITVRSFIVSCMVPPFSVLPFFACMSYWARNIPVRMAPFSLAWMLGFSSDTVQASLARKAIAQALDSAFRLFDRHTKSVLWFDVRALQSLWGSGGGLEQESHLSFLTTNPLRRRLCYRYYYFKTTPDAVIAAPHDGKLASHVPLCVRCHEKHEVHRRNSTACQEHSAKGDTR